jgi:MATE family multidrug resistance protein
MDPTWRTSRARRRLIVGLALPATLTLLAEPILGAVDTAIAGRIGAAELGALGLAVTLLGAVTLVFNFLVFGTTTSVARALGSGSPQRAGRTVAHAGILALILGAASAILVGAGAPFLVRAVGATEALVAPAVTYLRVRAFGIPFMLLGFVGHGAFRGAKDTLRPLAVAIVANLVNLGLNIFLVFELGWGLEGIALSTVTAEVIVASGLLVMIRRRLRLPVTGHGLPNRDEIRELISAARDLFIRAAGLVGGWTAIGAAAARTNANIAAAHQVIWQVYLLIGFLLDGLAIAVQSIIATAVGSGEVTEVRATVRDGLRWSVAFGAGIGGFLLVARDLVVKAFTTEPSVIAEIESAWWLPAILMALPALAFALDGILMGAADYAYIRNWTVAGGLLGGLLAQVGVGLGGELLWLWICFEVVMVLRALPLLIRVLGSRWLG